jgi:isopenicillin-N N-acyltransferase-like protein
MGAAHGRAHAEEIRAYTRDRVELAHQGAWSGRAASREDVLSLAHETLDYHRRYDPALFEEMDTMAAAAGISPAEAVIVGGFTDFVDAVRAAGAAGLPEEDDCTAVIVPGMAADGGALLAQTWDMHSSATQHIVMLDLRPSSGPAALVFTTVGCLGQIGMNEAGIAVGINNLACLDGRPGVTWPFVVRKALAQTDLDGALAAILEAELAGAHNYLVLDGNGEGYDIEAMPSRRHVTRLESAPLIHTNHCLASETRRLEAPRPPDLMSSSEARLRTATVLTQGRPVTVELLMTMTREPEAICRYPDPVYHLESCGAAIMRPATGDLWAVAGIPIENEYEHFTLQKVVI